MKGFIFSAIFSIIFSIAYGQSDTLDNRYILTYIVNKYKVRCGVPLEYWPVGSKWLYKSKSGQYYSGERRPSCSQYIRRNLWKYPFTTRQYRRADVYLIYLKPLEKT
jgi:hypothetical protein